MKRKSFNKKRKNKGPQKISKEIFSKIKKNKRKIKTLAKKKSPLEKVTLETKNGYPMRLSRALYLKNISSRREADRLIEAGLVSVNGQKAVLGMKVNENDKIEIKEEALKKLSKKKIVVFNKPVGVVSHNPQNGEKEPNDFLPFKETLSPIGRLDKASSGLLLMSNDGRLVNKLLNPDFEHQKEYLVEVDKHLTASFYQTMENGVEIEGYLTKPAIIKKVAPRTFSLILTEGKKHQIRRMCAALGYKVISLKRIRFMNIELGDLPEGS
jgi:23S rRNA pseudouridine2604 synthase